MPGYMHGSFFQKLKDLLDTVSKLSTTRAVSSFSLPITGTGATGVRVHATKDSSVRITYSTQITYSLAGNVFSRVIVKICSTNSTTEADWQEVGRTAISQNTGLAVTIGQSVGAEGQITAQVPAGWFIKASSSGSGTRAEAFVSGQKTNYG